MTLRGQIQRIHRRWMVLRLVESTGLAGLIGCGLSLILAVLLIWQGSDASILIFWLLSLSLLIGALAGWMRRPTIFDAAVETDRQLKLHELLSTALALENSDRRDVVDPQFREIILQSARQRCEAIRPGELMLNRLGARGWSSVGLATLLTIAIALLSGNPVIVQAGKARAMRDATALTAADAPQGRWQAQGSSRADSDPQPSARSGEQPPAERTLAKGAAEGSPGGTANVDSAGRNAARSGDAAVARPAAPTDTADATIRGDASPGAGASTAMGTAGDSTARSVALHRTSRRAAPWESDQWEQTRRQTLQSVESSDLPAAYRDLIRDYFSK